VAVVLEHRYIVGMRVDASNYEEAAERILGWARTGESRYVCVGTVHMAMEAKDDPAFREVVNAADLVTSDGMPLVWGLRMLGVPGATRVYGPDLTPVVCRAAAREGIPVGFHGGTPQVLERLVARLRTDHPGLRISYAYSPPFGPSSAEEEARQAEAIAASGCGVLFVGTGCPKQEWWMARMRGRIPAVMIGVGAAFDFLAGAKRQAPQWMQGAGLEWLFRLAAEPRRLWRRYLRNNPRFVLLFSRQLISERFIGNGREVA
jgi:N-acetylglucosaminyldiphosphoundecaprenol N-acetyl-beta-D-mannosaminyltransferase